MANTEFDRAYFERMAALEDTHVWTRAMRKLTLAVIAANSRARGGALLDAGCGTGLFLRDWAALHPGGRNAGIDYSLPALPIARERTDAYLAAASASEVPFGDGTFDAVHSADVLQHMEIAGARRAIGEFHRVLRPGGVAALRLRATRRWAPNAPDVDFDHAYTPALIGRQLREAGFAVVFLQRVNGLPSLAAELAMRIGPAAGDASAPVKGIALRSETDWRAKILRAYLAMEGAWLRAGGPGLPVGHTILAVGRKG